MRLLFVINGMGTGGAERSLLEMLPRIRAAGHEPFLACLHRREEGVERAVREAGFSIDFLPGEGYLRRASGLTRLARNLRPDLLHSAIFEADLVTRLAAARLGLPNITSLVNTSYEPVRLQDPNIRWWRLRAAQVLDGLSARVTTHFHAITEAVKRSAMRRLLIPASRITVIERGRDVARLGEPSAERREAARRALGLSPTRPVLLAVGRQEFQKGHEWLLRALPGVLAEYPDLVLLLAGRRGNASPAVDRLLAEFSLSGSVRLLGHRDDVPALLAAADVFVFPSLYEGLGGSVLEAMALGVPIVTTRLPALEGIVADGSSALQVPAADSAALARAMLALLRQPELASNLGTRARAVFLERFELGQVIRRTLRLYEQVLAGDTAVRA